MRGTHCLAALAAAFSSATAQYQGFNYGAFFTDNSPKMQSDFEAKFKTAQNLEGAPGKGFTSARLYTTLQWGTASDIISAIPAAIPAAITTNTTLLLGIWCSAGHAIVSHELTALRSAITTYGSNFTDLVGGISVGSEDLYRSSPTGIANHENTGANTTALVTYIARARDAVKDTALSQVPIGHVDTWSEWADPKNRALVDAVDFVGMDAYSYWQSMVPNGVDRSKALFDDALNRTRMAVGGKGDRGRGNKPVWVTETGFPVSGKTSNEAVPGVEGARRFWREVGCGLFGGEVNVWWYTLRDAGKRTPEPSFGIVGEELGTRPLFDISCPGVGGDEEDGEGCDPE
ncbi:hypothetical protein C8A01DRAFT_37821 [Parachaetomium inaequale]|uniref:Probable glucan endo-1,3-beta-glucosidase eglC n=1 Tax=Parachaetomium inaequale TaxID=2588326 RepID=A0AAN6PC45_9PEZI|nr:hypothetical protein C8A01DRAFT_37821 [Parachaetomium inaequale]